MMLKNKYWISTILLFLGLITSCIEDDIVDDIIPAQIRIINSVDTIYLGESFQFEVNYFDNSGALNNGVPVNWISLTPDVITITSSGLATAVGIGSSVIEAFVDNGDGSTSVAHVVYTEDGANNEQVIDSMTNSQPPDTISTEMQMDTISMNQSRIRTGTIRTTSSYALEGSFELREVGNNLTLTINDDYRASSSLPGLYVYLTNNPSTISNALEIGRVEVFEGAHSYQIENEDLTNYNYLLYFCKPFVVKVGDAEMSDPQ